MATLPAVHVSAAPGASSASAAAPARFVYFGTYTRTLASKGIYAARLDSQTGALTQPVLAAEAANPTFLARHPTLPVLYAVASRAGAGAGANAGAGAGGGVVIAYRINPETGALTQFSQAADGPTNGTYISITPDGRTALTAHYSGGYVDSFPIRADGSLGECASHIRHTLTGKHPQQAAPHPHCIDAAPDGRFAFVADLAADRVFSYRIDAATSALVDGRVAAKVGDESGARHLAFSRDGQRLYLINELAATVTVFDCNASVNVNASASAAGGTHAPAFAHAPSPSPSPTPTLTETQTISLVPPGFSGRRWASEIAVRPDGKFLYASNRADDESIATFAIDAATGTLAFAQRTGGLAQPRHFAISADGRWLLCANHDANDVVVFGIDAASGKLTAAPVARVSVPTCVCVCAP